MVNRDLRQDIVGHVSQKDFDRLANKQAKLACVSMHRPHFELRTLYARPTSQLSLLISKPAMLRSDDPSARSNSNN